MPDTGEPPRLTRLTFHGPLSEDRAARMIGRLTASGPRTVLDIGCGWGELMLRLLAATPEGGTATGSTATGTGIDLNEADLARGRENAASRGLADRVTFTRADARTAVGTRADLVLCLGASQALSAARPPQHLAEALATLRELVNPGGRVLLGEGFWERPPTAAELARMWPDTTAAEFTDLAGVASQAAAAGFRAEWIETASQDEWDDFESGYQADVQEWLATHDEPGLRAEMDQHRARYLRGYRGIMGLAYLTLIPDGQAAPR